MSDARAVAEALRFDGDTTSRLREHLDDLLETITEVTRVDDLWSRMADAPLPARSPRSKWTC